VIPVPQATWQASRELYVVKRRAATRRWARARSPTTKITKSTKIYGTF